MIPLCRYPGCTSTYAGAHTWHQPEAPVAEAPRRLWSVPSFDEVIGDHYDLMMHNARLMTGDAFRADDVVQEAMIRAMRGWDRFVADYDATGGDDIDRAIGAWLHHIVTNAFVNNYHHRQRAPRRAVEWAKQTAEQTERAVDPREHRDVEDKVAAALAHLDADDREILKMHYLEGMDAGEIAAELGCSRNAVLIRLSRAKERARRRERN